MQLRDSRVTLYLYPPTYYVQGPGARSGTTVRFKPDPEIFKTTLEFEFDRVASRLDELAYLNAGVALTLIDRR